MNTLDAYASKKSFNYNNHEVLAIEHMIERKMLAIEHMNLKSDTITITMNQISQILDALITLKYADCSSQLSI